MTRKLCTVCGALTSRGNRCAVHARESNRTRRDTFYSSPEWVALSQRTIRAHVGQYGWVCPGDGAEHLPHPSRDLTTDHTRARSEGGAPLDRANLRVLCRSHNSRLGALLVQAKRAGTVTPRIAAPLDERARIRARFLG